MAYQHTRVNDTIDRITLSPPMAGFDNFICSWLYRGAETFLVDPGPAVTTGDLLTALRDLGMEQLDFILLTHIHIDHAGGIGEISAAFPEAPVVCHEKAVPHLKDPEKLWQGTVKTLGETGRAYGKISAVPAARLLVVTELAAETVRPLITPGHAPHHVSYLTREGEMFAGETGGVNLAAGEARRYLRPATPPRFHLETAVASLDKLRAENPRLLCYGHTEWSADAAGLLEKHKEQLFFWRDCIAAELNKSGGTPEPVEPCLEHLLQVDPLLKHFPDLSPAVARRERYFLRNSIKGFLGYLQAA